MVRTLYRDSVARVVVNGEMAEEFETTGGVRQGCPLSPFLFIVILELMAIKIRQSDQMTGIVEPDTKQEDRVSLFADDSATMVAKTNQIRAARECIHAYEKATSGKLHDGKTKILKMGRTRKEQFTNNSIGVKFEIMKDSDSEKYLGDLVGHTITEEQRFGDQLEAMERTGRRWNQERIGIFGRAIVANTLLIQKIKYRADVNGISKKLKADVKKVIRELMWPPLEG
jgi:hypothetical protein